MDGWVTRLIEKASRKETFRSESALHEACYASVPIPAIEEILMLHPEAYMIKDGNGRIPLHWALTSKNQHGKARLVLKAMIHRMDELDFKKMMMHRNDLGYTALDHACCSDAPSDIIQCILSICPEAASATNHKRMGKTPLHMLLEHNKSTHKEINSTSVCLLLKAFSSAVRVQDRFGNIPLHYASYPETNSVAFQLLMMYSSNASCLDDRNELGYTPLHSACINDAPVFVIEGLLESCPSAVRQEDNAGNTPLHHAFAHGSSLALKRSLLHVGGEDLFGLVNDRGQVPIQQGMLGDVFSILRLMPHVIKPSMY
eukprot:scaffold1577_cov239-Chaetoceros_neogracile.AAC.2